ncbi:MAG: hypothetical protein ACK4N5_12370, partial [Myxococcales bacterium]
VSTVGQILAFALCEGAAISWVAVLVLTRDPRFGLGMALPLALMLRHWPTDARVSELARELARKG